MSETDHDEARVAWTEAARKLLRPRRGGTVKKARGAGQLQEITRAAYDGRRKLFTAGLARAEPDVAALLRAFALRIDKGTPLSVEAAAAGLSLLGEPLSHGTAGGYEPLVDLWAEAHGLSFAVEAAALSLRFHREPPHDDYGAAAIWVVRGELALPNRYGRSTLGPWEAVRAAVSRAGDADHAEAKALAARLREGAPLLLRAALSFAFMDEEAWSSADAAEALRDQEYDAPCVIFLLGSLRDGAAASRLLGSVITIHTNELVGSALDLVENLGLAAEEPLLALAEEMAHPYQQVDEVKHAALALAQIQSPGTAAFFVAHLHHKQVRAAAAEYFQRAPRLAIRALAPLATGRKDAADATALLAAAVRAHPAVADALLPSLGEVARAVVAALRGSAAAAVPEATPEALPRVLTAPPWLQKTKRVPPPLVEGLAVLARPESVTAPPPEAPDPSPDGDARVLAQLTDARLGPRHFLYPILELSGDGPLQALERFPHDVWYLHGLEETLGQLLARFGARAIDAVLSFASDKPDDVVAALGEVDAARVAPLMAHALLRLKRARRGAERWLLAHPETAAVGLVPAALGKPGKEREAAEGALRFLAGRGHEVAVRAAGKLYGDAASSALAAVLAADPMALGVPARAPKMPGFWAPEALPRLLVGGRRQALPLSAVENLGAMLAFTRHDEPYAGLAAVRAALDPTSLHEFAWALFSAWLLAGAPAKEQWAFFALGHLGGDEAARKLAPLLRAWPSEGAFGRAVTGLSVLAVIGSDLSLMLLHGISQKVKSRGLQEQARAQMDAIAAAQGLDADDLADRLVPDLGLDDRGSMALDFGARAFRVGFDEQLRPFAHAAAGDGKRLADLPKPARTDDPEKAAAAATTWKHLKRDARAVAAAQLERLERAMVARRRWAPEPFVACLVEHPLVGHLARRLVFGAYGEDGGLLGTFRVAEDRSYAGLGDAPFTLPEGAGVGLVHAAELSPTDAAAWGQILADYEILQPFAQIGREAFAPTEDERGSFTIDRFVGVRVDGSRLFGLDRFGWRRGAAGDGGMTHAYEKEVGNLRVALALDPGLQLGGGATQPLITLGAASIHPAGPRRGPRAAAAAGTLATLDPVFFSEIVRDLGTLRA